MEVLRPSSCGGVIVYAIEQEERFTSLPENVPFVPFPPWRRKKLLFL